MLSDLDSEWDDKESDAEDKDEVIEESKSLKKNEEKAWIKLPSPSQMGFQTNDTDEYGYAERKKRNTDFIKCRGCNKDELEEGSDPRVVVSAMPISYFSFYKDFHAATVK